MIIMMIRQNHVLYLVSIDIKTFAFSTFVHMGCGVIIPNVLKISHVPQKLKSFELLPISEMH